jgi:hypothetical protein
MVVNSRIFDEEQSPWQEKTCHGFSYTLKQCHKVKQLKSIGGKWNKNFVDIAPVDIYS